MDFTLTLLAWYETHARQLPWRGTGNPYHVWLSEVILQQTRVSQGMTYYYRFLEKFPTIRALAKAPLDDVMKLWQGLGYYTRARNLHKAAQIVLEEYGGNLPNNYDALRKLPGLGPYAAGAVASFAFNEPVPALDGNGYRVLARVFGIFEIPTQPLGQRLFRQQCANLIDRLRPADFNQALIDFGALQCLPVRPRCSECPMTTFCYAYQHEQQQVLPLKNTKTELRVRYFHYLVLVDGNDTYLELRQTKDIWHSLYQFPLIETTLPLTTDKLRTEERFKTLVTQTELLHEANEKVQKLTHQELHIRFFIFRGTILPSVRSEFVQIPRSEWKKYQMPIALVKFLTSTLAAPYFS